MAHIYNPSYSGDRDWENHVSRSAWAKVSKTQSQSIAGCGGMYCNPSYVGGINRKVAVQAGLDKNMRPYLKNNYSKKGWVCGLNGRAPATKCETLISNLSTIKKRKNEAGGLKEMNFPLN
jgi:hypothetical protein